MTDDHLIIEGPIIRLADPETLPAPETKARPMITTLLRAADRHPNGTRSWTVPGFGNAAKLIPRHSFWDAPAFSWPCLDHEGNEIVRTVRLDWHRSIAKAEARRMLAALTAPC